MVVAADAVLVAQHLLKLGAHLVTALGRLHVHNPTRRSSLEAGSKREKKGGEERRNVRNSYERGWPSYYNIVRRGKNVGVRRVQICVCKLAANASDCGWRIFAAFPL
jgi:hypothetical protein